MSSGRAYILFDQGHGWFVEPRRERQSVKELIGWNYYGEEEKKPH